MELSLWFLALVAQGPYVRVHDLETRAARAGVEAPAASGVEAVFPAPCSTVAAGAHGEDIPGPGTLDPIAFANPSTIIGPAGESARIAFYSRIQSPVRNQGILVHDGVGATVIVRGAGAPGGAGSTSQSGDPSPIGGTFSGLFGGTVFAPAVNANGDVLFLADVRAGSAPRGLFLFRAATGAIVKVAAVGDASPLGRLVLVGPGSLNAAGDVVFLASRASAGPSDILLWSAGTLTKVAAVGDASPFGSPYVELGTESFAFLDGTRVPVGPLPDIDDQGNVVFRAKTAAGRRGFIQREAGVQSWIVYDTQPAPVGGLFYDFQAATWSAAGEIAFFADVRFGSGTFTSGWFAGTTGSWRKGLALGDALGGGVVNGLALSRNPMTPLDDAGNLVIWADVLYADGSSREHVVVRAPDGGSTIVARRGDPAPATGGTIGALNAWPSLDALGRGTLDCATPGALGGVLSAHFLFETCPIAASASERNGSGVNAPCFFAPAPVLGAPWVATVDASAHPGATLTAVLAYGAPHAGVMTSFGELLVDPRSQFLFVSLVPASGATPHVSVITPDAALAGFQAFLQGAVLGAGAELCNAVDVVLGF